MVPTDKVQRWTYEICEYGWRITKIEKWMNIWLKKNKNDHLKDGNMDGEV